MQVTLSPELGARIQREIDRGGFQTPAEVIETALDQLEAVERETAALRDVLAAKLDNSFAAAVRGDVISEEQLDRTLQAWRARIAP
ncbi:MAG TPA: type II toxin-antitoxin system ParD family antitoxin [Acidobacteriaceae bacterium]|jgi:Arc/MetJ-type ribon-helix-helix transcriptional regulator